MTALNAILRPDAAYFISDGETWDGILGRPGDKAAPRPKVLPLPHLNAAIGVRGSAAMLPSLYSRITHRRQTFEAAAGCLHDDVRETVEAMRAKVPDLTHHDVTLIGWPTWEPGPECYYVCDHARGEFEPFRLYNTPGIISPSDGINGILTERMGGRSPATNPEFDPETEAVALIKAQSEMGAFVGDFVQVTAVYRDRIETRILDLPDDEEPAPVSRREELNALMAGA